MMEKSKRKNDYALEEDGLHPLDPSEKSTNWTPYILVGAGVVLILLKVFDVGFWTILAVAMVGLGAYILMNPEKVRGNLQRDTLAVPIDLAESAVINLNLSVGESTIYALPQGSRDLIHADVSYVGDLIFDVHGEFEKRILLKPNNGQFMRWLSPNVWFSDHKMDWRVMLSPHIPLDLTIHNGVGESRLDLKHLTLSRVNIHNGVGESKVLLPKSDAGYYASIRGGVGEIEIELPEDTNLDLDIKGGLGEIELKVPRDTGVQLLANGGIGEIDLSGRFQKVSEKAEHDGINLKGCWETKGYDTAKYQIVINYEGGIGELKIR